MKNKRLLIVLIIVIIIVFSLIGIIINNNKISNQNVLNIDLIRLIELGDNANDYTLSDEESIFLYNLVSNMQCRDYTCDGISDYFFSIGDKNYSVEVHANEIHILPSNDGLANEAIIVGNDYQKLKTILDKCHYNYNYNYD